MTTPVKITCPGDVAHCGWEGNYAADAHRFAAVNDYIRSEPDLHNRQLADWLANVIGMGVNKVRFDPTYDPLDWVGE